MEEEEASSMRNSARWSWPVLVLALVFPLPCRGQAPPAGGAPKPGPHECLAQGERRPVVELHSASLPLTREELMRGRLRNSKEWRGVEGFFAKEAQLKRVLRNMQAAAGASRHEALASLNGSDRLEAWLDIEKDGYGHNVSAALREALLEGVGQEEVVAIVRQNAVRGTLYEQVNAQLRQLADRMRNLGGRGELTMIFDAIDHAYAAAESGGARQAIADREVPRTRQRQARVIKAARIAMAFHLLYALDDENQSLTYQAVTARYRPNMPGSDGNRYWQEARECYRP